MYVGAFYKGLRVDQACHVGANAQAEPTARKNALGSSETAV